MNNYKPESKSSYTKNIITTLCIFGLVFALYKADYQLIGVSLNSIKNKFSFTNKAEASVSALKIETVIINRNIKTNLKDQSTNRIYQNRISFE